MKSELDRWVIFFVAGAVVFAFGSLLKAFVFVDVLAAYGWVPIPIMFSSPVIWAVGLFRWHKAKKNKGKA